MIMKMALEFELIFDDLVDNMQEAGYTLDQIRDLLVEQINRAIYEAEDDLK